VFKIEASESIFSARSHIKDIYLPPKRLTLGEVIGDDLVEDGVSRVVGMLVQPI
jgi:hypothetical protein